MKTRILIAVFSSCIFLTSNAQQMSNREKEKKWEVGINLNTVEPVSDAGFDNNMLTERTFPNGNKKDNSFSLGVIVGYKISDNCVSRFSSKITNYKVSENVDFREFSNPSSDYALNSSDAKQMVINLSIGQLWSVNFKALNFYAGGQLSYNHYNSIVGNTHYRDYLYSNNSPNSFIDFYQTEPGGNSIGLGPIAGFHVQTIQNLFIGAEFSNSYSYYKTGGAITTVKTIVFPTSNPPDTTISGQSFEGFRFSSLLTSINITLDF